MLLLQHCSVVNHCEIIPCRPQQYPFLHTFYQFHDYFSFAGHFVDSSVDTMNVDRIVQLILQHTVLNVDLSACIHEMKSVCRRRKDPIFLWMSDKTHPLDRDILCKL